MSEMQPLPTKIPEPQPRLVGEKNEFSFSMWVEMEGEPLLVHSPEGVQLGDKTTAWIAGQEGKVRLCFPAHLICETSWLIYQLS